MARRSESSEGHVAEGIYSPLLLFRDTIIIINILYTGIDCAPSLRFIQRPCFPKEDFVAEALRRQATPTKGTDRELSKI